MAQQAEWFDGRVAASRPVTVTRSGDSLEIADEAGETVRVALDDLIEGERRAGQVRLAHRSIEGWRLTLLPPLDPAMVECIPRRRRFAPTFATWPVLTGIAVTALATVSIGMVITAPETIARHMPMSWERQIAKVYELPANVVACEDPAAQRSLDAMVDRLDPEARKEGLTIRLLDVDDANAAALPGQRVVVFTGLVEEVGDVDALAGIIAHEMAHVRNRHVAAGMVRDLGIAVAVTLAGGGAVAGSGGNLLSLRFTREAESEADRDAIRMLRRARIDPGRTRLAFDRFLELELDVPAWASSHPPSKERGARFEAARDPSVAYRPALSASAAEALRKACQVQR